MLNFRLTCILTVLALLFVLIFSISGLISMYWLGLPLLFFLVLTASGSAIVQMGFYLPVYTSNRQLPDTIAITFDDGPHEEVTMALMQVLRKHRVEATFFCIGRNLQNRGKIVRQLYDEGHCIANHTYSHHGFLPFYTSRRLAADIEKTSDLLNTIIGVRPLLFRPPFGVTSPPYGNAVKKLGLKTIGWSIRSLDTVIRNPERLMQRVDRKRYYGDVLLFHDTNMAVVAFIDEFLERVKANGINVVRVDRLFKIQAYEE